MAGARKGKGEGKIGRARNRACKIMETVTEQPIKKIEFFRCPQSLPGVAPLTKKPEGSDILYATNLAVNLRLNRGADILYGTNLAVN